MAMLYRGVNTSMDHANGGRLLPKNTEVAVVAKLSGKFRFDGKFVFGPSERNTARAHQIETGLFNGRGVSTSRSEECAIRFATRGFTDSGYVYVVDEARLDEAGVRAHDFRESSQHPEHQEVTLINPNGDGEIPTSVIVRKYAVSADGGPMGEL